MRDAHGPEPYEGFDAYRAAAAARPEWAAIPAAERSALFSRARESGKRCREEVIERPVRQAGAVQQRAGFERSLVSAGMVKMINHSTHLCGRIHPGLPPGKENRVCRELFGVDE